MMEFDAVAVSVILGVSAAQNMALVGATVAVYKGLMWCWRGVTKDHPLMNALGVIVSLLITSVVPLMIKWTFFRCTMGGFC